ncbi:efflux transporter outer membrane subunit [Yersinia enterocolitica]|uniref:Rnd efflux system, outer membrane lipoprotein CmeC n=1 Tax=Yersinia enterocolitica subsp. palearctica serotype O:3 (strain DSM 13030 / CIP 106945 / Y11) TaxID=930944 RepID=A0A0H3NNH7_YERE1|nr:efflux transporter outer membrane subunit [Yersinia enterocolitica]EKN4015822.1 efflux transporter outer membrane subunit [Yersinia enterocolitica]CBY25927.1 rnd efflux system, outer membrane lipoprotein CmeC [Yersinia enterocolitica subsp. palearctica Y11]VEF81429.1 putative outer-membrane efflux lipoprotein [Yersinia enterocolitica subsp. palearctica]
MTRLIIKLSILLISLLLMGCGSLLKSEYQRPMLSVPDEWRVKDTGGGYLHHSVHWWENFDDPQLSDSISRMLVSNNDLAAAGLKLQQARLTAGLTNTNMTPNVTLTGVGSNTRSLNENTQPRESYSTSLGLSYELDLWGKLARAREQSAWLVNATEQDRQETALSLIGTTADLYWQIAKFNQQLGYQQAALAISQDTLNIVRSRLAAGDASEIELLQAQQTLLDRQNQYQSLEQQREAARNAMALLFNRAPDYRQAERQSLDLKQQVAIANSVPLQVIAQRPDVQAAEWRLRAALAGSDVAKLNFYPTLSLGATLDAGSALFSRWFSNPSRTLSANSALPFLQWNTVQLTIDQSKLDVKLAAVDFRRKVYSALKDVDDAMTARLSYQQQKQNQWQNLQLSQRRLTLTNSQYQAGAVSFQTLLDAQDALLTSETSLLELQYNYLNATMKLWLALGGGVDNSRDSKGIKS